MGLKLCPNAVLPLCCVDGVLRSYRSCALWCSPLTGCTEESKARELTQKLGVQVHRSMVVLSHSPMRALAPEYSEKRVMVLGSSAKQIAEEDLGLRDTVE